METNKHLDAKYLLQKLIFTEGHELPHHYPWLWEHDRWTELVFALLTQVLPFDHGQIRQVTDQLAAMNLLDIKVLADVDIKNSGELEVNEVVEQLMDILLETGFEPAEAKTSIRIICEAAAGLSKHYNCKIQHYLRSYGLLIMNDIKNKFSFTCINESRIQYAFTYWLQNVLSLPLSLNDKDLESFAAVNGLTGKQLIDEADNMDLNLAYLDDLVQHYLAKREAGFIVAES